MPPYAMKVRFAATLLTLFALAAPSSRGAGKPPVVDALKGLDPVALAEGKELSGAEKLSVTSGNYRYQFANEENRRRFEKKPEQYGIQMGGACARMGPLSGSGSAGRFYVHDGRIYVFASEACRNTFKASPESFLDREEPALVGTEAEKQRGLDLIKLALKGFGGAERVDSMTNVEVRIAIAYKSGNQVTTGERVWKAAFPGRFREDESWGKSSGYGHGLSPDGGFQFDSKHSWKVVPSVRSYMEREFLREPLALLKARRDPGFQAAAAGRVQVGESEVELLKAALRGMTVTMAIDPETGRIVQVRYEGRAGGAIGAVTKDFSDFRATDGLVLPFRRQITFNGKAVTNPSVEVQSVKVNTPIDSALFALPE